IRSRRMEHARELLASREFTVKQVAVAVGFNHVSNFSRSYRDWYGESPAQALKRNSA
ncbi:MAG TPA: AraC family transcriptional regulator, partial [Thalassospira sp.]|nr:AraC family transcriptional regulator [Thalassospira sp.]